MQILSINVPQTSLGFVTQSYSWDSYPWRPFSADLMQGSTPITRHTASSVVSPDSASSYGLLSGSVRLLKAFWILLQVSYLVRLEEATSESGTEYKT